MKPFKGILISFSGIDGVGKSTISYKIQKSLLSNYGIATRYVWCKFGDHPLSRYHLGGPVKGYQVAQSGSSLNGRKPCSAVFTLYGTVLLAFHLAQIAFAVRGSLRRGQSVICDRYVFDTMVDLRQELDWPMSRIRQVLGAGWIPQPDVRVLLDLAEETAFARKTDSASLSYLQERRAMYVDLAHKYGLTIVDAGQPLEAVVQTVMEWIKAANLESARR